MKRHFAFLVMMIAADPRAASARIRAPEGSKPTAQFPATRATAQTSSSQAKAAPMAVPQPVRIEDKDFLLDLQKALGLTDAIFQAAPIEVARAADADGTLIAFSGGTEIGRLDGDRARALLDSHPEAERALAAAPRARSEASGAAAATAWPTGAELLRWGAWKQEAAAGYAVDYLYSGVLVRRNIFRGGAFAKFGFAYLGADAEFASFKGELPDSVPHAGEAGHFGWGLQIGVDFLRYRLGSTPYALPEYFWAEKDLEGKYFTRNEAPPAGGAGGTEVVRLFDKDAKPSLEHRIEAKAGPFRYALTIAPGVYKTPLHYAALDGLPGGFGTWGMGALIASGTVIPGIWYRLRDFELGRVNIGGASRAIRFVPCRIEYFRAVRSQFRLAWSGEAALDL